MTVRMLAVFWGIMSLTGLITEYLFKALDAVAKTRPTIIAVDSVGFNYTTVLDVVALIVFAGLYHLYRNRERFGGGSGYAKDPVCGMQVETAPAPAQTKHDNAVVSSAWSTAKAGSSRHPSASSVRLLILTLKATRPRNHMTRSAA